MFYHETEDWEWNSLHANWMDALPGSLYNLLMFLTFWAYHRGTVHLSVVWLACSLANLPTIHRWTCVTMLTSMEWLPTRTLRKMEQCTTSATAWAKELHWPTTLSECPLHSQVGCPPNTKYRAEFSGTTRSLTCTLWMFPQTSLTALRSPRWWCSFQVLRGSSPPMCTGTVCGSSSFKLAIKTTGTDTMTLFGPVPLKPLEPYLYRVINNLNLK